MCVGGGGILRGIKDIERGGDGEVGKELKINFIYVIFLFSVKSLAFIFMNWKLLLFSKCDIIKF